MREEGGLKRSFCEAAWRRPKSKRDRGGPVGNIKFWIKSLKKIGTFRRPPGKRSDRKRAMNVDIAKFFIDVGISDI
jgi:hypothetical protein